MTKKEQEKRKTQLFTECLNYYMIGTLVDLENKIIEICNKYFPKNNKFIINNCYEYFCSLRNLNYTFYDLNYYLDCYFKKINHYQNKNNKK